MYSSFHNCNLIFDIGSLTHDNRGNFENVKLPKTNQISPIKTSLELPSSRKANEMSKIK